MKQTTIRIALFALAALLITACNTANTNTNTDTGATADYTLELAHYSFSPNVMTAKAGDTITVKLVGKEGIHDFVIDELDVNSGPINANGSKTVEITIPADAAGKSYEFYCSISDHRARGQIGTLTVTE